MLNKRNGIIAGVFVALIVVIIVVVTVVNINKNKTDSDTTSSNNTTSNTSTDTTSTTTNSEEIKTYDEAYLKTFAGSYNGTGALFSGAFQFPQASFVLNADNTFSISYNGLDLIITQSPALKVGDAYPIAHLNAQGTTSIKPNGDVLLSVENLVITFTVADQPVDAATTATILKNLASIFNLTVPSPTKNDPLLLSSTFVGTQDGSLNISNQTGVVGQIYIYFDGQKTK